MDNRKKWLVVGATTVLVSAFALFVVASVLARRVEPYIREQAIRYLRERFDSEVELAPLRVHLPQMSPLRLLISRGKGSTARVEGEGLTLRHKGRRDVPPMFMMKKFSFDVDLGMLFGTPKTVPLVMLHGMEINIPPKGERPEFGKSNDPETEQGPSQSNVLIEQVMVTDSILTILPKDKTKVPLRFDIHRLRMESVATTVAMAYEAELTNPKPPGEIHSTGTFGPWAATEPADTPLAGQYVFAKADLSVFSGIAGILDSTGKFGGTLSSIDVQGEATVPDFRLRISGNPVRLATQFAVLVDGTNGNTILQPVNGRLGSTSFTTSGAVIKHENDDHRTIALDVLMPKGNLRDLLSLAMKGSPFMEGQIFLKTKIDIPPLSGKVREKLRLNGRFEINNGKFLRSTIQDKIDGLSRRGQGQPKNEGIDEVISAMAGRFELENEVINFRSLSFAVPGAGVDLTGGYDLDADKLDFRGTLKLQAKVSQTMTGWKRWVLKPVDPFFSKQGAGTFLRIKIDGTATDPKFGLDRR